MRRVLVGALVGGLAGLAFLRVGASYLLAVVFAVVVAILTA